MSKLGFHPQFPDYYLYKKDDMWFRTDDALTKQISAHIFAFKAVQLPKIVFYPNWKSEAVSGAKYAAWRVNEFGERVVRWYWRVGEHSKNCGAGCKRLDGGRCAVKVPAVLEWNKVGQCYSLAKMPDKASDDEAKTLDNSKF